MLKTTPALLRAGTSFRTDTCGRHPCGGRTNTRCAHPICTPTSIDRQPVSTDLLRVNVIQPSSRVTLAERCSLAAAAP